MAWQLEKISIDSAGFINHRIFIWPLLWDSMPKINSSGDISESCSLLKIRCSPSVKELGRARPKYGDYGYPIAAAYTEEVAKTHTDEPQFPIVNVEFLIPSPFEMKSR